jgi:hypothetical protein
MHKHASTLVVNAEIGFSILAVQPIMEVLIQKDTPIPKCWFFQPPARKLIINPITVERKAQENKV